MRLRDYVIGSVLVGLTVAGCGTATTHETLRAAGPAKAPAAAKAGKMVVPDSPDLKVVLSPTSGAPGTVVHVTATGCVDATGLNHAVSFNVSNRSAARNPHAVRAVESALSGSTLTASYTVSRADRAAAHGVFYVQCGSSVASAAFRVTR